MRTYPIVCAALLATVITGCASTAPTTTHSTPKMPEAAVSEPPFTPLTLPNATSEGAEREVKVLVDAPHLKTLAIVLRNGSPLSTHIVKVPVIIQAMSGAGHVLIDNERVKIDAEHVVMVRPSTSHSVEPDPGTNLVLLIHQVRGGARHGETNSHHDHGH